MAGLVANLQGIAHTDADIHQGRFAAQLLHRVALAPALQVDDVAALARALEHVAFAETDPAVAALVEADLVVLPDALVEATHQALAAQHVERVGMGDEGTHVVVRGAQHDLFRLAVLDDPAVLHDRDAGADLQRLVEVVADEHDGLVQLPLQHQQP